MPELGYLGMPVKQKDNSILLTKAQVAPKFIDKPDYPDLGIEYRGYAKKLLSNQEFQLIPQTPFFSFQIFVSTGAPSIDYTLTGELKPETKYFINQVLFSVTTTSVSITNYVLIRGVSSNLFIPIIAAAAANTSMVFQINLAVPLEVNRTFNTEMNSGISCSAQLSVIGFREN